MGAASSGPVGAGIDVHREGDISIVALEGEHDIASAQSVREAVEAALRDGSVVVDLTPARFVDSTILGVLIAARDRAQEQAVGFAVLQGPGAEPGVRRILDITGLVPLLPVVDSLEAARAAAG